MRRFISSFISAAVLAFALAAPSAAPAATYVWRPDLGTILIRTDRGGLFSRMGHRHEIRAQSFAGTIEFDPTALESTRLDLVISAASLKVLDPNMDPEDVVKIQSDMESKVLEVEKYPEIRYFSSGAVVEGEVQGGGHALRLSGTLALHGVTRPLEIPVSLFPDGATVRLLGHATIRQKDYEIEPISVGLGAVTVKNEVRIEFDVVAQAPGGTSAGGGTIEDPPPAAADSAMSFPGAPADSAAIPR